MSWEKKIPAICESSNIVPTGAGHLFTIFSGTKDEMSFFVFVKEACYNNDPKLFIPSSFKGILSPPGRDVQYWVKGVLIREGVRLGERLKEYELSLTHSTWTVIVEAARKLLGAR